MDPGAPFELASVPPTGARPTAGAVSRGADLLAVGLDEGGVALFRGPGLGPDLPPPALLPGLFRGPCSGAQVGRDGVTLLGIDAGAAARAAERSALVHLPHGAGTRPLRVPLGPGDWALVKGGADELVHVYDTETGRGLRAYEGATGALRWAAAVGPIERVARVDGELLGVDGEDRLVRVEARTGRVVDRSPLPGRGTVRWTAWTRFPGDRLLLAGFDVGLQYVLAVWRIGAPSAERLGEPSPPEANFPPHLCRPLHLEGLSDGHADKLRRAGAEPPADISQRRIVPADLAMQHRVAAVRVLPGDRILLVLGGDAEARGLTHGGCVVCVVEADRPERWRRGLVDERYGCSAFVPDGEGGWVLDCGGRLRVLRSPPAAS